jgi:glutamate synthase (NADPH/NADH) large chain
MESLESIIYSMVTMGKEEIGSMGDDTPLAVLSDDYRPISHFFRQHFSQITNPPIDPLREQYSMCLKTRFCNLTNLLEERELDTGVSDIIEIRSPVILNCVFERLKEMFSKSICEIQCVFDINGGSSALSDALAAIRHKAEQAIRDGRTQIVLTDMGVSSEKAPIPMILATSAVHSWIVLKGLRAFCSILVRSAECHDSHYFSVLIGCGATVVNAWLAEESIISAVENSVWDVAYDKALGNFKVAIEQGILKIMSKRGISVISSYRGGYNFEAIGLSRALVTEYFPGMQSRISGIGLSGIQKGVIGLHKVAFAMDKEDLALPIGGYYKARSTGETHFWQAQSIHLLQTACTQNEYRLFQKYSEMVRNLPPIHLRDLLDFRSDRSAVLLDEVETITSIRNRFVTPGMSLGALSPEAHEILNVAMNRIGAKSNSGEGGEDPTKISPLPNGDCRSAKVRCYESIAN